MFIVRCASGVTSTIERAVGTPKSAGGVMNSTPVAREIVAVEFAELVGRDLADEAGPAAERRDARPRCCPPIRR